MKKEVYESLEQCHSSANLVVNEVVGLVHSALDPLAGLYSHASQLEKKKKKRRETPETQMQGRIISTQTHT